MLAKLDNGLEPLNEPCQNNIVPDAPIQLQPFTAPEDTIPGNYILPNPAFTGYIQYEE